MSLGLTLLDDTVDIYVLGCRLASTPENELHLETIRELELKIYTDCADNAGFERISTEHAAEKLLDYDHILPY